VGGGRPLLLRKTDGSPAVRLGAAIGGALSPDGKQVLALPARGPGEPLRLLPTGPGEVRTVSTAGVRAARARFFPDGKRALIAGEEPGRAGRLYVLPLEGGAPRPITEEGVVAPWMEISRDGRTVATLDPTGHLALYPAEGGPARLPPGVREGEIPYGWSDDGSLFVGRPLEVPIEVFLLDPVTGARRAFRTIKPGAPGAFGIGRLMITPDGRSAVYSYAGVKTHLYLVSGAQ
jgi:hypothetical protein